MSTPFVLGSAKDHHRDNLWKSICSAQGFGKSFSRWWVDQKVENCLSFPLQPPEKHTAEILVQTMEENLRSLESLFNQT